MHPPWVHDLDVYIDNTGRVIAGSTQRVFELSEIFRHLDRDYDNNESAVGQQLFHQIPLPRLEGDSTMDYGTVRQALRWPAIKRKEHITTTIHD